MATGDIVPVTGESFEQTLASASPDMLREMIRGFAQRMMDAEVEGRCGAGYGEVSPQRVNSRDGYRRREWDTRAETSVLGFWLAGDLDGDLSDAVRGSGREVSGVQGDDDADRGGGQQGEHDAAA